MKNYHQSCDSYLLFTKSSGSNTNGGSGRFIPERPNELLGSDRNHGGWFGSGGMQTGGGSGALSISP